MAFQPVGGRRFRMSHGPEWPLVEEALLLELTRSMDGELVDPLKTTVAQGQRRMTTWVLKKMATPEGRSGSSSARACRDEETCSGCSKSGSRCFPVLGLCIIANALIESPDYFLKPA